MNDGQIRGQEWVVRFGGSVTVVEMLWSCSVREAQENLRVSSWVYCPPGWSGGGPSWETHKHSNYGTSLFENPHQSCVEVGEMIDTMAGRREGLI